MRRILAYVTLAILTVSCTIFKLDLETDDGSLSLEASNEVKEQPSCPPVKGEEKTVNQIGDAKCIDKQRESR